MEIDNKESQFVPVTRLNIGTKILLVIGLVFILFTLGLASLIGSSSFNNLTQIKQSELERTSQILASQVAEMEQNADLAVKSFEQNEPIVSELQLLTLLGPYYADPGSYFEADFLNSHPLEDADKVYVFQAQLNLLQLLQSTQQINNFSSISYYHLPPFDIVPDADPILAFQLNQQSILLTQFNHKRDVTSLITHQIATNDFRPPPPDFFDISSAYSGPVDKFYEAIRFSVNPTPQQNTRFTRDWQGVVEPRSEIIIEAGIPVIQTWYPVQLLMPHPITWEERAEYVGIALVEQRLGPETVALLAGRLGLDIAFAQDDQLLISSIPGTSQAAHLDTSQVVTIDERSFSYAWETVQLGDQTTNLQAVVLSPVSELEQLTGSLRGQIINLSLLTIMIVSVIIYVSLQYLLNRPLSELMQGVQLLSSGNLSQEVKVNSADEMGQLAYAFNGMASQLKDLVNSLEQRVAARTHRLKTVAELAEQLNTLLDVDQVLTALVDQVKRSFDYSHTRVYLVDERNQTLAMAATASRDGVPKPTNKRIISLEDAGLVAKAARTGEIIRLSDIGPDWLNTPTQSDTFMEMAVPIIVEDKVLGVLNIQKNEATGLDEGDANMLRSLANYVAVAIKNARLFEEVQQRATELAEAHKAAEDARRKAESANQAKSEFLSSISHELRTPLNGILGYTQVLRDNEPLTPQQAANLGVIEQSGEHLLTLINDILDLAKIEAQKMELFDSDIYLPQFLESLVRIFQIRSEKKHLLFHSEIDAALTYTIRVDEKRLRQIIINLLSNAFRFTDQGRVDFRVFDITAAATDKNQVRLRFEVEDTGVGIHHTDVEKIFMPLEQAGDGQSLREGTGLGLAISQNLARMMGSQIYVASTPNQGSRFWFDLEVPVVVHQPALDQSGGQKIMGYNGRSRQIMVVDDEAVNRQLIVQMLAPLGFEVLTAVSGEEVLAQIPTIQPDLILMDLKMPGLDGLETTRQIRSKLAADAGEVSLSEGKLIIIAASASAFQSDQEESLQAGCDGFLTKPIKRESLLKELAHHLELNWVYTDNGQVAVPDKEGPTVYVMPPAAEMAILLDLAKSGKLRRILDRAAHLREVDPAYTSFADEVEELAKSFQEKKLLAFIQQSSQRV